MAKGQAETEAGEEIRLKNASPPPPYRKALMIRYAFCASVFALVVGSISFGQPATKATPLADKAIKDAVAVLEKQLVGIKDANERTKISKAIASLESVLSEGPSKATRDNYAKVTTLVTVNQVNEILGPGKESSKDARRMSMAWRNGRLEIIVRFEFEIGTGFIVLSKSIFGD